MTQEMHFSDGAEPADGRPGHGTVDEFLNWYEAHFRKLGPQRGYWYNVLNGYGLDVRRRARTLLDRNLLADAAVGRGKTSLSLFDVRTALGKASAELRAERGEKPKGCADCHDTGYIDVLGTLLPAKPGKRPQPVFLPWAAKAVDRAWKGRAFRVALPVETFAFLCPSCKRWRAGKFGPRYATPWMMERLRAYRREFDAPDGGPAFVARVTLAMLADVGVEQGQVFKHAQRALALMRKRPALTRGEQVAELVKGAD